MAQILYTLIMQESQWATCPSKSFERLAKDNTQLKSTSVVLTQAPPMLMLELTGNQNT